jgi:hypothetical protein
LTRPESWQSAIAFHKQLIANKPKKPEVELAVLRPYTTWALSSRSDGKIRNSADWMLQQFLEVWAVKYKRAYDVFEIPPGIDSSQKLAAELKKYKYIVSLETYPKAWVIGKNTITVELDPDIAQSLRNRFENQMIQRGMFKNSKR